MRYGEARKRDPRPVAEWHQADHMAFVMELGFRTGRGESNVLARTLEAFTGEEAARQEAMDHEVDRAVDAAAHQGEWS